MKFYYTLEITHRVDRVSVALSVHTYVHTLLCTVDTQIPDGTSYPSVPDPQVRAEDLSGDGREQTTKGRNFITVLRRDRECSVTPGSRRPCRIFENSPLPGQSLPNGPRF